MLTQWINDHHGSRRGLLNTYKHRTLYYLGKYNQYKAVDWAQVRRLVFVCKGNVCRSAFAEAVARNLNIAAISCGLDTHDGKPANPKAILAAKKRGLGLDQHQTQKITSIKAKSGDLFVVMEPCQLKQLQEVLVGRHSLTLLGLWSWPITPYIHDPYSNDEWYFDTCFSYIQDSVRGLANKMSHAPHRS